MMTYSDNKALFYFINNITFGFKHSLLMMLTSFRKRDTLNAKLLLVCFAVLLLLHKQRLHVFLQRPAEACSALCWASHREAAVRGLTPVEQRSSLQGCASFK